MVKCESLRIHMFRITHTGKSVNFPVTKNDLSPDINKLNSCPFSLCQKKHPTGCQFVCINDTHVLNQKHTLVRTGTYNIIHFYQNVKGNVFTQFCWGVQIRGGGSKSANGFGRGGEGSISTSGFGPGVPYPLADLDRRVQIQDPNPLGHQDDVSSHLKYHQLSSKILDYKLILFRSGHFDHDMEKI